MKAGLFTVNGQFVIGVICPPALALGLNRLTGRECALAVAAARREFRK